MSCVHRNHVLACARVYMFVCFPFHKTMNGIRALHANVFIVNICAVQLQSRSF